MRASLLKQLQSFGSNLEPDKEPKAIFNSPSKEVMTDAAQYSELVADNHPIVNEGDDASSENTHRENVQRGDEVVERLSERKPEFETEQALPGRPDLFGFKPPMYEMQQERYEHRIIAELKALGKTNREIAEITGFTSACINYVVKQPWCKQYIMDEIHRNGGKAVLDYMKNHAMVAAETIVEAITDDEMIARRDKAAIANSLLDRVFGKADQTIKHAQVDPNQLTDADLISIAEGRG